MIIYLIYAVLGYLSGSILYSQLIARKFCAVDITQASEDGNPGAFNVFKYGKIKYGILSLCMDMLKGIVPVYAAARQLDIHNLLFLLILIAPVIGHAFSPFLHFHGGKAIATSFGCLIGLFPNSFIVLALAVLFILFSYIIRIKPDGLRSIVTYSIFSLYCLLYKAELTSIRYGCIAMAIIVIYKHVTSSDLSKWELRIILLDKWLHRN